MKPQNTSHSTTYKGASSSSVSSASTSLASDAVALQHHFATQLGLATRMPKIQISKASKRPPSSSFSSSSITTTSRVISEADAPSVLLEKLGQTWVCDACRQYNAMITTTTKGGQHQCCKKCMRPRNIEKSSSSSSSHTTTLGPLTLAQARGLVPGPAAPISDSIWAGIEARALTRNIVTSSSSSFKQQSENDLQHDVDHQRQHHQHRDQQHPTHNSYVRPFSCPICMESIGLREAVLTSCSHMFHKMCLDSLERFSGGGGGSSSSSSSASSSSSSSCPMCRTIGYQRRRTRIAARAHIQHCVAVVQAMHRGRVTRRMYFELRRKVYLLVGGGSTSMATPTTSTTTTTTGNISSRKAAFVAEALGELQKRFGEFNTKHASRVKSVLADVDDSLRAARAIMQQASIRLSEVNGKSANSQTAQVQQTTTTTIDKNASIRTTSSRPSSSDSGDGETAARLLDILAERLELVAARQRRLVQARRIMAAEAEAQQAAQRAREAAAVAEAEANDTTPPAAITKKDGWKEIRTVAISKSLIAGDCAVCMMPLGLLREEDGSSSGGGNSSTTTNAHPPPLSLASFLTPCAAPASGCHCAAILSCSHVFHDACIDSLEKFAAGKRLPESATASVATTSSSNSTLGGWNGHAASNPSRGSATLSTTSTATTTGNSAIATGMPIRTSPWPRCPLCRSKYWRAPFHMTPLVD